MRRAAVLAVGLTLASAAPAVAQNGVTYDPSSPAGKEYAIPADAARRDTAPKGTAAAGSTPLFGAGVKTAPAAKRSPGANGSATRAQGKRSTRVARQSPQKRSRRSTTSVAPESSLRAVLPPPQGGTSQVGVALIALLAAAVCSSVGIFLRRRSTSD